MSFWDDTIWLSGRLGNCFIDQQDGNAIANRVGTAALAALQRLPFMLQYEGFLASRADQDVEQVLRNHGNGFYAESFQPSALGFQPAGFYWRLIAESRKLGYDKFPA